MTDEQKKDSDGIVEREPIWFKEVECQACGAIHKTPRVKPSFLKAKSIDSDFHKVYENIRPLLYAVTICNDCNYAARNEDYDKVKLDYHKEIIQIAQAIKQAKKNHVFKNEKEVSVEDAVNKHLLAIMYYKKFKPANMNTIAGLYMHIVWMYREEGDKERELEFTKDALNYYIQTYEKGIHIPEKIGLVGIMYLIGDMYRKLGDRTEAVKWFARVTNNEEIDTYPSIKNLTRDAWEIITEEKKNGG